jgi:hypothetical protein
LIPDTPSSTAGWMFFLLIENPILRILTRYTKSTPAI